MKNWSIKLRLWITTGIVIVLIVCLIIILTYYLYQTLYIDKQIERLHEQAAQLEFTYQDHGTSDVFFQQLEMANFLNGPSELEVLYTDDPMLLGSGTPFEPFSSQELINFSERQLLLNGETITIIRAHPLFDQDILAVALPLFENEMLTGALYLSIPLAEIYEPFSEIQGYLITGGIISLLIITLIIAKTVQNITHPLNKMKALSQEMAEGDFSQRIKHVGGGDELRSLANAFNSLASSLHEVETKRKEFLANVSHELRTPLSYMKGYVEAVKEEVIEPKKGLSIIQKESARLERIVHDLLDLAQLEGESYPIKKEPIAMAQLIHDVVESFELAMKQAQLNIHLYLDEEVIIFADYDRMEQVLRNLLDNALRFTGEGKSIFIQLYIREKKVYIRIQDEGVGIAEKDISSLTERFYRVNKGRTRAGGGTGLGLSITSQIIKLHGGNITITSKEHVGTNVLIELPFTEMIHNEQE
ncbi:sensor histidine kinase [Alkalihalobacillus pseudalcaliphilus]|uniref:sensor histidine kinase n=1 Tax=Alkalihalobacillus pseudalcaliphilus TaxID=79884 RepID=UPI00064DB955|nr:HAMP domain-containing sensor histidine kinase [Alkalihalobacillus pseudalcaliphilus]KMK77740.1 histidine kinase [Alkalihalobacillus pseudalcaliphilus]